MEYSQVLQILESEAGFSKDSLFDFRGHPKEDLFKRFFDFAQFHADHNAKKFGISPCYFFYTDREDANGAGGRIKNCYVTSLTKGFVLKLEERLKEKHFLSDLRLRTYHELQSMTNENLDDYFFETVLMFGFYHEFAHAIQWKVEGISLLTEDFYGGSGYDFERHIREYDADLNAANLLTNHVQEFFNTAIRPFHRTQDACLRLHYLSLAAIAINWILFLNQELSESKPLDDFRRFYTKENTHPHFLIRIAAVLEQYMFNTSNWGIKMEQVETLKNVFTIVNIYFSGSEIFADFFNQWLDNVDDINRYVDELYAASATRKNLVRNKYTLYR